ncbi:hypothetical protein OX284_000820 [Flavobacterium sp. SUN046]|uniref:hypothetical protein n=1 Tax=Flavobacterium sp. SUN046 TaxID=3002440 RepID=UPI002DB62EBC|nr:hypothetical protein [Flavobacterium sp. SUN046]MEC4047955.1 hypothetical protein [Flavobacterium sp. SUN046]
MTKILLKIIPFLIIFQSYGQDIDISSSKPMLLSGFPNYLTVNSKNFNKLTFETDNGTIQTSNEGQIIICPKVVGSIKVMVFDKKIKIFEKTFEVKDLKPILYFPTLESGQNLVSKSDLFKIHTISIYFPDLSCSDFSDTKFKCDLTLKTAGKILQFTCNTNRIPDNVRSVFNTLERDDEIIFKNIIYTVGDKEFYADDVVLKVI